METQMPQPIDVNRLKGILGNAKSIMDKVVTGDYETGQVDGRALSEEGVQEMMSEGITRPQGQAVAPQMQGNQAMYKNMETSKMPSAIKEAMMATPIPQGNMNHTFNIEDVQSQQQQQQQRVPQQYPSTPNNTRPIYEQQIQQTVGANTDGTFTVSESTLRAIVNEMFLEFMTKTFTQNLSEDVIKKTISTLIKEGKINVKKKTR